MVRKSQLPRLEPQHYRGESYVFWTYTIANRQTGWLTDAFHRHFRELLLHATARYCCAAPTYCLMPDHLHWLGIGLGADSNQLKATRFLRQHLSPHLAPARWQHQSHDHVLREHERQRDAVNATCHYITENPVRSGLAEQPSEWPYSGAILPGYPNLNPTDDGFHDIFWRLLARVREANP